MKGLEFPNWIFYIIVAILIIMVLYSLASGSFGQISITVE